MLDGDAAEAHLSGAQRVPDWVPGFCPKVQHHNGNRGARRFPDLRSEGCGEGKGHRESTRTVSAGKTVSQTLRRAPGGTAEVGAPAGAFEDGGGSHTAPPAPPAPARPGAGGGRAPRSGGGFPGAATRVAAPLARADEHAVWRPTRGRRSGQRLSLHPCLEAPPGALGSQLAGLLGGASFSARRRGPAHGGPHRLSRPRGVTRGHRVGDAVLTVSLVSRKK